ncbi:MAG: response regulator transcription factor, partial [bacterium]
KKSATKIIFLTMHKEEDVFNKALDLGVMGYILKESASEDIIECIKTVAENKHYISPIISEYLINRVSCSAVSKNKIDKLTHTEKNILKMISDKKTSKEIAETLFISIRTVENHRTNICNKLELHGNNSLLLFAVENKHLL